MAAQLFQKPMLTLSSIIKLMVIYNDFYRHAGPDPASHCSITTFSKAHVVDLMIWQFGNEQHRNHQIIKLSNHQIRLTFSKPHAGIKDLFLTVLWQASPDGSAIICAAKEVPSRRPSGTPEYEEHP